MNSPFLRRASAAPKTVFATREHQVAPPPSKHLQLVIRLVAHGFVHLQPPFESHLRRDVPGKYDHILNGEVEVIAPAGFAEQCQRIKVGMKTTSKLNLGPGRMDEQDVLFERTVEMTDGLELAPGRQSFSFSLIVPCTTPAHDFHRPTGVITHKCFAELETISTHPPPPIDSGRDYFSNSNAPSATEIAVTSLGDGSAKVFYTSDVRMRISHMPKPDADFSTLDLSFTGLAPDLGLYHIEMRSDIWSISAPFLVTVKFPELNPDITIFSFRTTIIQSPTFRSPRLDHPCEIRETKTMILTERGQRPPAGHAHPGKSQPALWRGKGAGGKDSEGLALEIWDRMPNDSLLRPSTLPGIETPIENRHTLCFEVYFSVHGYLASGKPMPRAGPGELRRFQIAESIFLPSCDTMPEVLHLPTYDESFGDPYEGTCACKPSTYDVVARLQKYVASQARAEAESEEAQRAKRDLEERRGST